MNGGDPLEAWARTKAEHPAPGELVDVGRSSSTSSRRSSSGRRSSRCRRASRSPSRRRPTSTAGRSRACGRRGRSRAKPTRAYYYLTDVDPSWPPERQDEHLRDFNYPTLWSISIHEVYPGHFLHYPAPAPRRVEGAQVDHVRAGVVRRRLGALLRADDDRGGLRPSGPRRQARPARRSAHPPRPLHRRHPAARRGHVGRAGRAVLPRRSVHGGERARGARPSAARSTRPTSSTPSAS